MFEHVTLVIVVVVVVWHVRALILKSLCGVFSAACRMTNQKKSVCHTHKYIYYEAASPSPLLPDTPDLPFPTIAISVKRQSLFEFRGGWGVWKVVEVKQATTFEQLANYALQLLSQAGGLDAVLNDLQVKWIITNARGKRTGAGGKQGHIHIHGVAATVKYLLLIKLVELWHACRKLCHTVRCHCLWQPQRAA